MRISVGSAATASPVQDYRQTALSLIQEMTAHRAKLELVDTYDIRMELCRMARDEIDIPIDTLVQSLAVIIPDNDLLWALRQCGWEYDESGAVKLWKSPGR